MAENSSDRTKKGDKRSSVERFAQRIGGTSADPYLGNAPVSNPAPHAPGEVLPRSAPPAGNVAKTTAAPAGAGTSINTRIAANASAVAAGSANIVLPAGEVPARRTRNRVKLDMERLRTLGLVTSYTDQSHIAEEFRLIKRPLLLKAFADPPDNIANGNLIMVTSSKAGEGKTFCAVSLAMSIALERDLTVLLVDADVAKPDVPNVLGIETEKGLVDLIADDHEGLDLSDVLVRTDLENLTILPAGRQHHLATELLASEKMDRFVEDIAQRYPDRVIIFDSPPVLLSSIPAVLALHVGQILFIVEAQRTAQTSVDSALGLINTCNNISLLLNKASPGGNNERFGAYYGYGYGSNRQS